jgi:cytochrome c
LRIRLATALLIMAAPSAAQDAGEAGRRAFETHCAACHALDPSAPPMAGPNLAGLVGRRVAADAAFGYSPVLQRAGRAGRVWDIPMLGEFLADPEAMFPGLWMGANGVRDAEQRAALVRFIAGP